MDEVAAAARRSDRVVPDDRGGDFEGFFEREHARLFRALWLLTRDRHEAEEIMQDAFLALWQRWDRLSATPDPTGYLFTTAMNIWRSRSRRAATALRKAIHRIPPDEDTKAIDERDAVIRALAPLPPRQRAAVVLTEVLDLTSEQAARVMRISPSTVRVLAARARARLAKEIGGDRDD
jgi:RNA polymerase sigma-70 factor (sigma-E family)